MIRFFRRSVESSYDELFGILQTQANNQRIIMGDLANMNASITALTEAAAANTAAVADVVMVVADLKAGTDQAAIDAAAASVATVTTQVAANTAALEGLKPPVVVPPAPAV